MMSRPRMDRANQGANSHNPTTKRMLPTINATSIIVDAVKVLLPHG